MKIFSTLGTYHVMEPSFQAKTSMREDGFMANQQSKREVDKMWHMWDGDELCQLAIMGSSNGVDLTNNRYGLKLDLSTFKVQGFRTTNSMQTCFSFSMVERLFLKWKKEQLVGAPNILARPAHLSTLIMGAPL